VSGAPDPDRVLVVIPAFNEKGKIGSVLRKMSADTAYQPLVVDDGSQDGTAEEAAAAGAQVVRHDRNRGVGAAIRTGIDYARAHGYPIVAIVAGDDQHDPSELPALVAPLRAGTADFVQGSRRLNGVRAENIGLFRRVTTEAYSVLFGLATRRTCTDATNGFRAFRTTIFDDPRINLAQGWLDTYELEPYLLFKAVTTGKRVLEVPTTVIYHHSGTTKMKPVRDWWRILRPLIFLWLRIRR
jgi:dolichol-phosphate mannosyltransferase